MQRFLCIHGHFYQPPRENPWLESIELQDSAYPYHDWNQRISAECYAPNSAARDLDGEGRITGIVSNYARISFNFGPTLLSWMERYDPASYRAILEADLLSRKWRSGHGAALAQVYNHAIMPLCTLRDKTTQVRWGLADFQRRFQRPAEGMWLAETAVDTETLEVLAREGILFTVLAPHQAAGVRRIDGGIWADVAGGRIDPSRAYLCRLPSGRSIALFFYDGPIAQGVAFEKLLNSGEKFAERLMSAFSGERRHSQLAHIATDGETYGHHHPFGGQALGYALTHVERHGLARLTNYGEFLALHPPAHEVQIVENSSWSCQHGIERWRGDCGCNSGGGKGWHQKWRRPLREALEWLAGRLAACYQEGAAHYLKDPWGARDAYITVVLERSEERVADFLLEHSLHPLDLDASVAVLELLEMQRHALLMFTSCGWFFDEISGLETVQVLQYAGRALQLAERHCGEPLEELFLERLALAPSNLAELRDGAQVYLKFVRPAMIDLIKVGAHYAVSSVFEPYAEETGIFSYRAFREDLLLRHAGAMRLAVGRIFIRSEVTREADRISFCTLYFGGHALNCGVRSFLGDEPYRGMRDEVATAFEEGDFGAIVRLMDVHFGMHNYSLRDLFRDEQRQVLKRIIAGTLREFEEKFTGLYESSRNLMAFVRESGMPMPQPFLTTAQTAMNLQLQRLLAADPVDAAGIGEVLAEISSWQVALDGVELELLLRRRLEQTMALLLAEPGDPALLEAMLHLAKTAAELPLEVNLWLPQNLYWELVRRRSAPPPVGGTAEPLSEGLARLGELLYFNVPALVAGQGAS